MLKTLTHWYWVIRSMPYIGLFLLGRWYVLRDAPLPLVVHLASIPLFPVEKDQGDRETNAFLREARQELDSRVRRFKLLAGEDA